jgi:glutamine cyclotransferase
VPLEKILMRFQSFAALSLALIFPATACSSGPPVIDTDSRPVSTPKTENSATARQQRDGGGSNDTTSSHGIPTYTFEVVNSWPHDCKSYTQGLVFHQNLFFESAGHYGESSLRRVEPRTGKVLKKVKVSKEYFAEGIAIFEGKIFQLTWESQKGFIYDLDSFKLLGEFTYDGQGWGMTHDGHSLIMSDGTNQIRFLDPVSFKTERTISVYDNKRPVSQLNELEYVKGEIYANIWHSDRIVRLDPATGKILGWIDLTGLLTSTGDCESVDVLNGIAYDEQGDRLFVTGKDWPKVFEIRLKKK